ncbi:putative restriction endonuclease [Chryseolinea serpens]|uniref:Putative restriction endonuclease n=1 Tax=Chryseolinea serpens TaxID=947013 RepID=A0A1M5MQF9_9BACT|nr:HNH endonuclease [Chryseolinea serpens]SHG79129.1 putative restriction endonuclease [Chryseolinea serpens]
MNFYLGVTDTEWFNYLKGIHPEDVNFWQPGGKTIFKAISPGAPFLFKLKKPFNAIGGLGFFSSHTFLPISMAWEIFGERNGCESFEVLYRNIKRLRSPENSLEANPNIGCIVLTNPIFFQEQDWIEVPESWSQNIVQGKGYISEDENGKLIWDKVKFNLEKYGKLLIENEVNQLNLEAPDTEYSNSILKKIRLGQGAFRVLITDAYAKKCAVTGEKTLPVLDAAHIIPYGKSGPSLVANGILLRSDLHKLFDSGYITITTDYKLEVSKKIREEFQNGKEYYKRHGNELVILPIEQINRPSKNSLDWHNENVYKG